VPELRTRRHRHGAFEPAGRHRPGFGTLAPVVTTSPSSSARARSSPGPRRGQRAGELVEAIMGIRPASDSSRSAAPTSSWATRRRARPASVYIPETGIGKALLEAPLWENRSSATDRASQQPGSVARHRRRQARYPPIVQAFDVRTPHDVSAASLSGGNQQKLIVGREMSGARSCDRRPSTRRRRRGAGRDLGSPAARLGPPGSRYC